MLLHIACSDILTEDNCSVRRSIFSCKYLKKRCFTAAVYSDKTDPVALLYFKIHIFKKSLLTEFHHQLADCNNSHADTPSFKNYDNTSGRDLQHQQGQYIYIYIQRTSESRFYDHLRRIIYFYYILCYNINIRRKFKGGIITENENESANDKRTVKRKAKDSVFTFIFKDVNNVYELYRELHPEDTDVTVDDIHIETLETVLVNDVYNDLGFIVRSGDKARFVILVEAQSKWTENLTLRMLIYIVETYRRYLKETQQSEHLEKRIILPGSTAGDPKEEERWTLKTYYPG